MAETSTPPPGREERTSQSALADKLSTLIASHWEGHKAPGNALIARQIREETGLPISNGYLWMLRTGARRNPTGAYLQALARFFGKPSSYFLDEEEDTMTVDAELAAALKSEDVTMIALRSNGLSTRSKRALLDMIEQARAIERLDEP